MKMLKKINNLKNPIINSENEPIIVDFITPEFGKLEAGKVGITIAPGANHEHGNVIWQRDLKIDMARLKTEMQANVLISLVEDFEFENLQITKLPEIADEFEIKLLRYPLVDAETPKNFDTMNLITKTIQQNFEAGNTIIIHCLAGLGRSGMVAACWLVTRGFSGQEAINHIQTFRKNSLFLECQQRFIIEFNQNLISA
jgi:protein-tyrosine phosphatase